MTRDKHSTHRKCECNRKKSSCDCLQRRQSCKPKLAPGYIPRQTDNGYWEIIADQLKAPLGLAYNKRTKCLYVTQSGVWTGPLGSVPGRGDPGTYNNLGGITEISNLNCNPEQKDILTGLTGYPVENAVTGPGHITIKHGKIYVTLPGSDRITGTPLGLKQQGRLFEVCPNGDSKIVSNVGTVVYQWTEDHPEFSSTNPPYPVSACYGVAETAGSFWVIDAPANVLSQVYKDGTVKVRAWFPFINELDPTPSAIVVGPDGFLYVGTLAFRQNFTGNFSKIYKLDPNVLSNLPDGDFIVLDDSYVYADNLRTINGLCFSRDGKKLYVSIGYTTPVQADGDVEVLDFQDPTKRYSLTQNTLAFPGQIAVDCKNRVYCVSNVVSPFYPQGIVDYGTVVALKNN